MNLISMKRTKKEIKTGMKPETVVGTREEYPWGLQITLNDEELKKLGLDVQKRRVGEDVYIAAQAKVTRVSQSEEYGSSEKCLGIQLQKVAMEFESSDELGWDTPEDKAEEILGKRKVLS